jgi:hypothetical protein
LSALDHGFHGELHMLEEQTRIVFRGALPSRVAIGWPSACPLMSNKWSTHARIFGA